MSKPANKSAAFLQALNVQPTAEPANQQEQAAPHLAPKAKPAKASGRSNLKHIGGYFAADDVEKFAILRARLRLDNSQLIQRAIDELYKKNEAKRAFGDA